MQKMTEKSLENYYLKAEECETALVKNGATRLWAAPKEKSKEELDDNYLTAAQTPAPAAIPKAKAGPV